MVLRAAARGPLLGSRLRVQRPADIRDAAAHIWFAYLHNPPAPIAPVQPVHIHRMRCRLFEQLLEVERGVGSRAGRLLKLTAATDADSCRRVGEHRGVERAAAACAHSTGARNSAEAAVAVEAGATSASPAFGGSAERLRRCGDGGSADCVAVKGGTPPWRGRRTYTSLTARVCPRGRPPDGAPVVAAVPPAGEAAAPPSANAGGSSRGRAASEAIAASCVDREGDCTREREM